MAILANYLRTGEPGFNYLAKAISTNNPAWPNWSFVLFTI
jgi:hypothetical protein